MESLDLLLFMCGTLLGTLSGNSREVLSKLTVELP